MNDDSMGRVIQRVRSGETEAFRAIIEEYQPRIRLYVGSRLEGTSEVDDLTQETFVAAYEGLARFQAGTDLEGWIFGIARHKLASHFRRRTSEVTAKEKLKNQILDEMDGDLQARARTYVPERIARLKLCLDRLADRVRAMMEARYFREEKVEDIARREGTSANAVSAALRRGRTQLRSCMEAK